MTTRINIEKLYKQREKFLSQISDYADFVRGSITSICSKCKRANCLCQTKTSRKDYRLTYKDKDQKTKIVYIPKDRLAETKRMIKNHSKVKGVIQKLVELNFKILKHRQHTD